MRTLSALLLLTLAAATLAQEPSRPAWKPFTAAADGFSVLLPGTPIEQKQKARTDAGAAATTTFAVALKEGTLAVSHTRFTDDTAQPGLQQRRLDNARDGLVSRSGGKLRSETRIELEKQYPGRELVLDGPKDSLIRTRLFAVGNRLYQLIAIGSPAWVNGKETACFFDSFKLLKGQGSVPGRPGRPAQSAAGALGSGRGFW
ncbi:MAG: hypothetical protein IT429_01120 [Gemmataceae bacterium]|nr:hypothetical protein [Gemmataceae bacterium]